MGDTLANAIDFLRLQTPLSLGHVFNHLGAPYPILYPALSRSFLAPCSRKVWLNLTRVVRRSTRVVRWLSLIRVFDYLFYSRPDCHADAPLAIVPDGAGQSAAELTGW